MSGNLVEVEINDLAFDGKSVGHMDGKVVFLDAGLPGELVLARITKMKPRYNVGVVTEITRKSDLRVAAPCEHFNAGMCGGCAWQDLAYDQQLRFKMKHVVDSIERIGGLEGIPVNPIVGAEEIFHYRNKMEFSFHTEREGEFTLGLHRRGRFDDIFDIATCWLTSDSSNRILHWVRDFVARKGIPVYDISSHTGYVRFLVLREAKRTGEIMVNLVTNYGEMPEQAEFVEGLTCEIPSIATIIHNQNGQKSNIAVGEIEQVLYGPGYIQERLFDHTFRIRANSFFQTNSIQTETLYRLTIDAMDAQPEDLLMDLYCGAGSIGILASSQVKQVVGVELVPTAIAAARENAELNGVTNIEFVEGDVKAYLSDGTRSRPDIVVLDPPRAGLHPKVIPRVVELGPRKLVYVSCNPTTFARDAALLVAAGYQLHGVTPVDMFPHTRHIELVARFTR